MGRLEVGLSQLHARRGEHHTPWAYTVIYRATTAQSCGSMSQSLGRRVSVTASLVDVALKWKQGVLLVSGTYTKAEQNKVVMTYRRGRRCDVTCFYSIRGRCGVRSATIVHALHGTLGYYAYGP